MKFFTTYDANSEANLDEVLDALDEGGFEQFFADKFYDDSGIEMAVVLMCRNPQLNFAQRIRFSKKENCLYMDLMLDLDIMRRVDSKTKKQIVGERFVLEIPQIIKKKGFRDFDLNRFTKDLRSWFVCQDWINE
ncbi:MAG: hypothetical protein WBC19_02170 [Pyrinomonadaceae bacterium]|nr:hypothetical protein [Chloracidobacterium sp.]